MLPTKFYTITPCRLYDSRTGDGPFLPGEQRELQVTTSCGIPDDAVAIAANLTAVGATATGNAVLFPDPLHPTNSNAVSFKAGGAVAANGIYPLSDDGLGTLSLLANLGSGQVDLILDISGYFRPDTPLNSAPAPACKTGSSVQANDCWEGKVQLLGNTNPCFFLKAYREARIRIEFRQDEVLKYSTYAFWDGGLGFSFRTAFPFKGSWTWKAVCENCLGRTVSPATPQPVTVTNRRTSPLLYSRGALSVDPSGRFLKHQTGLKFFWLGDTAWTAPMRTFSVQDPGTKWATYLDQRETLPGGTTAPPSAPTAGKYSVVQVALAAHVGAGGYGACTSGDECIVQAKKNAFVTLAQNAGCLQTGTGRRVPGPTSYWNPKYWRNLDQEVYGANEKGVVVVITGVMDLFGHPNDLGDTAELEIFARNLAARMAGYFVIYSVGWDNRVDQPTFSCGSATIRQSVVSGFTPQADMVAKMKAVGMALDAAAPQQLITTHLGGGTPYFGADTTFHDPGTSGQNTPFASPYSYFHREPWLDFHLFQSSQCNPGDATHAGSPEVFQHQGTGVPGAACANFVGEDTLSCTMRRARTMPPKFLATKSNDLVDILAAIKPVVDGEARYERTVLSGPVNDVDIAYNSRHAAFLTTLSGAFGFTGGVYNVGEWRWPGDGMGITGPHAGKSPDQLKYLSLLQEGQVMEWERLRRKEAMLRNAGTNEKERSVVAVSEGNQTIVAYLPERIAPSPTIPADTTIQLAVNQNVFADLVTCRWAKTWWNPVTGVPKGVTDNQIRVDSRSCGGGEAPPCSTITFSPAKCQDSEQRPNEHCDWILLLHDLGSACASTSVQSEVWNGLDEATGRWGIFSQRRDASGALVGPTTTLGDLSISIQGTPRVARNTDGALAVWIAEDGDGEGFGIVARRLDSAGLPVEGVIRVTEPSQGDMVSPSVASLGASGYLVSWTAYSADADQGEIYARYIDAEGNPQGLPFRVNQMSVGRQDHSQVAADTEGNVLIAWESWGQDGDGNGVFARRFDPQRTGSDEFQVYQSGAGWQYLAGIEIEDNQGFEVKWQVFTPFGRELGTWGQRISPTGSARSGTEFFIAGPEGGMGQ